MTPPIPGPVLAVLIGAAGSGKSTWAGAHYGPTQIVCLDELRARVADDESDQCATPAAVGLMNQIVTARMARGRMTVVDATNTTTTARRVLVGLASQYQMPAVAVVFSTPLGVCLVRNSVRPATPRPGHRWARQVPEEVVRRQYVAAAAARTILPTEGFTSVRCVDADGILR